VRRVAVQALEALGPTVVNNEAVVEGLLACLKDSHENVHEGAIEALADVTEALSLFRKLRRLNAHPRWLWRCRVLVALWWLCDWLVLICALLAQVLAPWLALANRVPLPPAASTVLGWTSWWQILIIVFGYLWVNIIIAIEALSLLDAQSNQCRVILKLLECLTARIDEAT
jgi:hypothetical protein